jgi:hypothetical protein|tara:strand:- start:638 stop:811 length:174 start_codon:yes stop_codon:yes gene_type:complete
MAEAVVKIRPRGNVAMQEANRITAIKKASAQPKHFGHLITLKLRSHHPPDQTGGFFF